MSHLIDIFSEKMINVRDIDSTNLVLGKNLATHSHTIDLDEHVVIKGVSIDSEMDLEFRFRVSENGDDWLDWGHIDSGLYRYVNYEILSSLKSVSGAVSIEICVPFSCDLTIPASCRINTVLSHETDGEGIGIKCVSEDIDSLAGKDIIKKEQLESGVTFRVTNYEPKETSIRNVHFIV